MDALVFWITSGSFLILTVVVLVRPLISHDHVVYRELDTHEPILPIYRNQLLEIEHDVWRELLEEKQVDSMQLEIYHRILCTETTKHSNKSLIQWLPIFGISMLVPVGTICIYLLIGSSSLPDRPISKIRDETSQVEYLVHRLAKYMKKDLTGKSEGWLLLARSQRSLGHHIMAAQSFHMAIRYGAIDADTLVSYSEMLVISQNGQVSPEAAFFLRCAYLENHRDPRIAFYLGLNALQIGDPNQAIALWKGLEVSTFSLFTTLVSDKIRWQENIQMHIETVSRKNNLSSLTIAPIFPADIIINNNGCAIGEYSTPISRTID